MSYQTAVTQINSADLKGSVKLFAVALLTAVNPNTGGDTIPLANLTETMSEATLRNRLSALKASGILDYRTDFKGAWVEIKFTPWGEKFTPTGEVFTPGGDNTNIKLSPPGVNSSDHSPQGVNSSPPGVNSSPVGVNIGHHVSLLEHTTSPEQEDNKLEDNKLTAPDPAEIKANKALLKAANVNGFNRNAIANRYTFRDLMAHVMAYRAELSLGKVKGPGALVSRCLKRYGVDPITGAAPVDELYNQHVTPQALATYAAGMPAPGTTKWTILADTLAQDDPAPQQKGPESETAPQPTNKTSQLSNLNSDLPPHPEGQAVWAQALDLLRPAFTASSFQHLTAATVTDYQNGNGVHLTLTAPPESLDFLQSQGRALIRRALGQVKRTGLVDLIIKSAP